MSQVFEATPKPADARIQKILSVRNKLAIIISREVKAGNPHAIAFLTEAMQ